MPEYKTMPRNNIFKEAGLPDGVINMIYGDPVMITDTVLASSDFATKIGTFFVCTVLRRA